jgi:hypothetical protein
MGCIIEWPMKSHERLPPFWKALLNRFFLLGHICFRILYYKAIGHHSKKLAIKRHSIKNMCLISKGKIK